MDTDAGHELQEAITAEAATWRMLRAHLPGGNIGDLAGGDVSGLSAEELALVGEYLAAREYRRRLLHPVVPDRATRVPTAPPESPTDRCGMGENGTPSDYRGRERRRLGGPRDADPGPVAT